MTGIPLYGCRHMDHAARLLEIDGPDFDYDNFAVVAETLLQQLGMTVVEKEANADLHVWLVDFEGCRMLLKGEHYSGQMWLEGLDSEAEETMRFLAGLLGKG
ncbi:DUF3630 domain-containing protein [Photobacterium gaetbulicola]|uniref:Uncharacterized protein n=1 Tax=Photobacterium gaetbulicola Gung47 TaxID=658445 RepID=A0A0C5WV44_9GAMM|nr:DUF3630 family protein [Photobacterium gaetbulicola]AJR06965.1 hypothetical protein H744_2c0212 [Photobacterium gaetbulicola Gung47]PSU05062.1 DUF3630 domain-containing protein [Photobacterium gaetbulicola]